MHMIRISDKETFNGIKFVSILIIQRWERLKSKVNWGGPVKSFFWELKFIGISNAHRDVVIIFQSLDAAPEQELLKVSSLRAV